MFPCNVDFGVDRRNLVLFIMYSVLGFCLTSPQNIIRYFLVRDHHLGPSEIASYGAIIGFPWSLKPLYGVASDNISVFIRKRFQISFGYCLSALCFSLLSFFRSIGWCIFLLTLSSFFLGFADVVQDSIMVVRGKDSKGRVQSNAWFFRSFGSLIGCIFGATFAFHMNRFSFIAMANLLGVVMALQLKNVDDTSKVAEPFLNRFCSYIRQKEILVFALVLFLYSYEPGDGFVVEYLLIQRSNIKPTTFALADIVSFIMVMAASAVFSRYLRKVSVYKIVMTTNTIAFTLFAYRNAYVTERLDIDPKVFLMLNSIVYSFIGQLSFLPMIVIATNLSPPGMEGTIYSFFMAVSNASGIISRELSSLLTKATGISNELHVETSKVDLFYLICILLDLTGLVGILLLLKHVIVRPTSESKNDSQADEENQPLEECTGLQQEIELTTVDLDDSDEHD